MNNPTLPPDWDRPEEENIRRCELFEAFDGSPLKYRLFSPKGPVGALPLVVFLHGADAFGEDNQKQISMHDIATVFAGEARQLKQPCHIVCPQCNRGKHWSMADMQAHVLKLIDLLVRGRALTQTPIDENRIYIYGYSAGAVGLLELLKLCPDRFAAAISICGATGRKGLENLERTPIWFIHAADDRIVRASYNGENDGPMYYLGSRDICAVLGNSAENDIKYTEFPAGYMKEKYGVNPHCSWVAVSEDGGREAWDWLLQYSSHDSKASQS